MNSKFKLIEFKVGLFSVVILTVSVFSIFYIGLKNNLFSEKIIFYIISATGENIERGIPVKLSGFNIGYVNNITLDNINYIKTEIKILKKYSQWFKYDSKIILEQEGIIGKPFLKLIPGSDNSSTIPPNSDIILSKVGGLKDIIAKAEPVIDDLEIIVSNFRETIDQFLDPTGKMQITLDNIEYITNSIVQGKGLLYYFTQNKEPVHQFKKSLKSINSILTKIDSLAISSNQEIKQIRPLTKELLAAIQDARQLILDFRQMSKDIVPIVHNVQNITAEVEKATDNLGQLRQRSDYALDLGTRLLQELSQTWPFSLQKNNHKVIYPLP